MSTIRRDSAATEIRPAVASELRRPLVALTILGALLVAVPGLVFAGETEAGRLDRWVQSGVDNTPSGAHGVLLATDWFGEPTGRALLVLALAVLCLIAGRWALAAAIVAGSVTTAVLTTALKFVVDRQIHGEFLSYPSGHTAAATAAGLGLGLLLAGLLRAGRFLGTALVLGSAALAGAAMAWAQIALGAHYPTDTVGGFGCALLVLPGTALLIDTVIRPALR
jgi:undecaprenyl-diphosphatase